MGLAIVLVALIPVAVEVDALVMLAILATLLATTIAYETLTYGDARTRLRRHLADEEPA